MEERGQNRHLDAGNSTGTVLEAAAEPEGEARVIDVWRAAREELRSRLGDGNFASWLKDVQPVRLDQQELVLGVRDAYTRDWLEQRMRPVIRNALATGGHPNLVPVFVVAEQEERSEPATERASKARFNRHYTFAEFVVGPGNRLAHAGARACIDEPGKIYNPLVLYGGVGVGKTHLLQAIGQAAIDHGRGEVLYATSEAFTNELIGAIRNGETEDFRERYRSAEYLLLDDIQFIAGKEATQEEFFHTFNALHQVGKQIVVTCDRSPSELRVLEGRLRSRFAWGLIAEIEAPDLEMRKAIVRTKAEHRGRSLPEEIVKALATYGGGNVREVEGAMNRIFAFSDLLGIEPGMEIVRTVLGAIDQGCRSCKPAEALRAVSSYYGVKLSELAGGQRDRRVAYPRQIAMYLLREDAKLSLVEIGSQLGGRNHSTVIYGCDKICQEVKRNGRAREDVESIRETIYNASV